MPTDQELHLLDQVVRYCEEAAADLRDREKATTDQGVNYGVLMARNNRAVAFDEVARFCKTLKIVCSEDSQ